jgi:hypothetical protein
MVEQNIENRVSSADRAAPVGEPSIERMPYVPPSVVHLGDLSRLTQLPGSV